MLRFDSIVFVLCFVLLLVGSSFAGDLQFRPPLQRVPFVLGETPSSVRIDLSLNERSELVSEFATTASLYADSTAVYITVTCLGQPAEATRNTMRDHSYWEEDSIEVFIALGDSPGQYCHYVVNSLGGLFDELIVDAEWNGAAEATATRSDEAWTIELAIPAVDLCLSEFSIGDALRLNICRNIGNNFGRRVWAPIVGGYHDPPRFGFVELMSVEESIPHFRPAVSIARKDEAGRFRLSVESLENPFEDSVEVSVLSDVAGEVTRSSQAVSAGQPFCEFQIELDRNDCAVLQWEYIDSSTGTVLCRLAATRYSFVDSLQVYAVAPYVYPGLDSGIFYQLPEQSEAQLLELSLFDAQQEVVWQSQIEITDSSGVIVIPFKDRPLGEYLCRATLQSPGEVIAREIAFVKPESPISFDDNKRIIVDGEVVFPFAMYMPWPNMSDGQVTPLQSAEQVLADLDEVAAKGFNSVVLCTPHWYANATAPIIARARQLGLYFALSNCSSSERSAALIEENQGHLLAWMGADEPEGRGTSPEDLRNGYFASKQNESRYPLVTNHMWLSGLRDYLGCRDIIAMDPYCFGSGRTIDRVPNYIRHMRQSCNDLQPTWVILQLFQIANRFNMPTIEQNRCQTFLAMFAGADGIFYYSTATPESPGWHLLSNPADQPVWESFTQLSQDVYDSLPFFESPIVAESQPSDEFESEGLFFQLRMLDGESVLLLINGTEQEITVPALPVSCSLELPGGLAPYQVVFVR